MKAVFIDAVNRTVTDIDLPYAEAGFMSINRQLGCDTMTLAYSFDNFDVIFADDEGLFNNPENFFIFSDYDQPIAGNGLVLGGNEWGESVDVKMTAAELAPKIAFASAEGVRHWFARANIESKARIDILNQEMGDQAFAIFVPFPEI